MVGSRSTGMHMDIRQEEIAERITQERILLVVIIPKMLNWKGLHVNSAWATLIRFLDILRRVPEMALPHEATLDEVTYGTLIIVMGNGCDIRVMSKNESVTILDKMKYAGTEGYLATVKNTILSYRNREG